MQERLRMIIFFKTLYLYTIQLSNRKRHVPMTAVRVVDWRKQQRPDWSIYRQIFKLLSKRASIFHMLLVTHTWFIYLSEKHCAVITLLSTAGILKLLFRSCTRVRWILDELLIGVTIIHTCWSFPGRLPNCAVCRVHSRHRGRPVCGHVGNSSTESPVVETRWPLLHTMILRSTIDLKTSSSAFQYIRLSRDHSLPIFSTFLWPVPVFLVYLKTSYLCVFLCHYFFHEHQNASNIRTPVNIKTLQILPVFCKKLKLVKKTLWTYAV